MNQPYAGSFRITKLYGTPPPKGFHYAAGKHAGIDLVGVASKEIRAVLGGTVYRSAFDADGWGRYLVIRQSDGRFGIYCHLSKSYKAVGQKVGAGEVIGLEGSTGQATGSHLHFELRTNYGDKYSTLDPAVYLGLKNRLGKAEVTEVKKQLKLVLNGREKTVTAIESGGHNFVKLQDLRDNLIAVGYQDNKPTISVQLPK